MNMKDHILSALREQFNSWEELLATLSEEQITAPRFDFDWSVKDVMAHLWAWQQISIARMEAARQDQEPEFPKWIVNTVTDWERDTNQVNAVTFENYHNKPWVEIYQMWTTGFQQLLEVGNKISEVNLLATGLYSWLKGYSLAFILVASYDHHQEHLEKLLAWRQEHGD